MAKKKKKSAERGLQVDKETEPKKGPGALSRVWAFLDRFVNTVLVVLLIGLVGAMFIRKDRYGVTIAHKAYEMLRRGEVQQVVKEQIRQRVTGVAESCSKPSDAEVEAHYKDNGGSLPVEERFDSAPGEICGNGKSLYCTSKPPKKPIPAEWEPPPLPGQNPEYQGPPYDAPFKESPYAMPSSKQVLIRPPISDLNDPELGLLVDKALAREEGKLGFLGVRTPGPPIDSYGKRIARVDAMLFKGDDDEPAARALLDEGIHYLFVDRTYPPAAPWMEIRMSAVELRLRDAVSLSWFHPVVIGSGIALYRVAEPLTIPAAVKRQISARIRSMFLGEKVDLLPFSPSIAPVGYDLFRVIVSLRSRVEPGLKGRKLVKKAATGGTLIEAIDNATWEMIRSWADIRQTAVSNESTSLADLPSTIQEAVQKMEIEVEVLYDICALADRTPANLLWYLELGLEGIAIRGSSNFYFLEPSYAVHMEVESEVRFLEKMLMKNQLNQFLNGADNPGNERGISLDDNAWRSDRTYQFQRFRTIHWIEVPGGGDIVELYRGVPLKTIWDVNRPELVRSLELGARWLMHNQRDDGQYAYQYTPTNKPDKRWTVGGNVVRHALNPYTLLMVNKIKPDPVYVESAKRGIEFTLKFLRRQGNRCVICHRDPPARYYNAKIGTVAVTILSILKLGEVADISSYDEVLRCFGEELLYMQDKNGHFWQYDVPEDHPYYGAESTIAPGEFIFALARLYTHYGDERYKKAVDRALPYYTNAWRMRRDQRSEQGVYDEEHRVNLIGIVPWLVTALNDLHKATQDPLYAKIAFEMQDWIDNEFFWYFNRAQYPDYVGASFKVQTELPAINSCQYTEGAAAAYDLAKRVKEKEEERRLVVVLGMRFCLQTQYDSYGSTFFLPVPEEALGGYRYTLGHLKLRNDYNYHAMAAIAQAVEYLLPSDYPAERPLRVPPVLKELLGDKPNPDKDVPRPPREGGPDGGDGTMVFPEPQ